MNNTLKIHLTTLAVIASVIGGSTYLAYLIKTYPTFMMWSALVSSIVLVYASVLSLVKSYDKIKKDNK
jgi:hypothetical protein